MKERIYLMLALAIITGVIATNIHMPLNSKKVSLYQNHKLLKESKEETSAALDALQFTTEAANYPNKTLPRDAYVKGMAWYQQEKEIEVRKPHAAMNTSWMSLGPLNGGGRTIGIAIDPTDTSVIWLGSASGGLWKSTTGGIGAMAWTYVPLGFPVLGISSIAINPLNDREMYVGSGEVYSDSSYSQGIINIRATRGSYGMGLFHSIDGGITWTQAINWTYQQNLGIWDIKFNPLKPTTVYAATTIGILKSMDAGKHWDTVLKIPMVMNLVMHNVDTNILLCGVGNYGSTLHGIYRTTNSGATWAPISSGLPVPTYRGRITLATYSNNNDTMFAHICDIYNSVGIYISTNSGLTWTQQTPVDLASYQGWYAKGLLAKPGNPNLLLVGGVGVFESTDMGLSFNEVDNNRVHSDIHDIVANPHDPNKVYILTDGDMYRTNDFGQSYFDCGGGYNTTQSYIGSISATDTTVMLSGLQDNYTIKYYPSYGAGTWIGVVGGDGCYNAIDHTNDQVQYGAYQYLNVFTSNDQGNNFFFQILTYPDIANSNNNYAAFLAPYTLCYSNTQYIYAGAQDLLLSTNGGSNFNVMGKSPVNNGAWVMCIAPSFTNTDSVYFCTAPDSIYPFKMFFSANQGKTVTDITNGLPDRFPRRIAVNPSNSKEVYIVFSGFGTGHIFKSTNGGGTWTNISTQLPDMPFEVITVDPANPTHLFAGCDFGTFYSTDDGNTWTSYDNGFPDATMVFDLLVSPSDHYLYAFTFGRGIYKRDLSDIPAGVADVKIANEGASLYPNPSNNEIHINLNNYNNNRRYNVSIYNLQGEEVYNINLQSQQYTVPVSLWANGIYVVKITDNNSVVYTNKFVKE